MLLNVKSYYSHETVKCCFLQDAIKETKQENVDAADFVLAGPSNAGNVTDEENKDNQIFDHSGLPGEVSEEIEVVSRSIEPNTLMQMRVKTMKTAVMVMSPHENRKSRIKKPKIEKEKKKPKWKKSHLKNPVVI